MGAHTTCQVEIIKGDHNDAYRQAVQNALYSDGHDAYNGTISTTNGCLIVTKPKGITYKRYINEQIELCEKWGPARVVELVGDAAVKERKRSGSKGRVYVLMALCAS